MANELKNPIKHGKPKGMNKGFIYKVAFTKSAKIFIEPMRMNVNNTPVYLVDHPVTQDGLTYWSHMQAISLKQYNRMLTASGDGQYCLKNTDAILEAYHRQMKRIADKQLHPELNLSDDDRDHKTTFYYAPSAEMRNDNGDPIGLRANAHYLPVAASDLVVTTSEPNENDNQNDNLDDVNDTALANVSPLELIRGMVSQQEVSNSIDESLSNENSNSELQFDSNTVDTNDEPSVHNDIQTVKSTASGSAIPNVSQIGKMPPINATDKLAQLDTDEFDRQMRARFSNLS